MRSWPLRPTGTQCREIRTRFFTGVRVYNAVLGEFIARSRAVKADPAWQTARELPRRNAGPSVRSGGRRSARSSLRTVSPPMPRSRSRRRCGGRGCANICPPRRPRTWGHGRLMRSASGMWAGKASRGSSRPSVGCIRCRPRTVNGALRPKTDAVGRLVGLQWGAGFVVPIAAAAAVGSARQEQQAELAEIEALIAAGKVLSTRIVRTVINGRDTYRMQLVVRWAPDPPAPGRRRTGVVRPRAQPDRGGRVARRRELVGLGGAAGRCRSDWTRAATPRPAASGSPAPCRLAGLLRPRWHPHDGPLRVATLARRQRTTIRVAELHRRLAEHRKTLHGALANRLLGHGTDIACEQLDYVSWQKNFPRSVRDRAPGLLVEMMRRKAESAGGAAALRVQPTNDRPVANLSVREP